MVDNVVLFIFTGEFAIKVAASGLYSQERAYLRSAWNLLDLVVIAPLWISTIFQIGPSLAALRVLRSLRPLRTIRQFPEVRRTIEAFLKAGAALSTVAALTAFFFLVFGIVGMEMFQGTLHTRCAYDPLVSDAEARRELKGSSGGNVLSTNVYCALNASVCGAAKCIEFDANPAATETLGNFDSFAGAAIVTLQALTFNDWHVPMRAELSARPDMSAFTFTYFYLAMFIGGFMICNLFIAVIFDEVMRSLETMEIEEELERQRRNEEAEKTTVDNGVYISKPVAPVHVESTAALAPSPKGPDAQVNVVTLPAARSGDADENSSEEQDSTLEKSDCCGFESALKPIGYLTSFVIMLNTTVLCLPYRGMPEEAFALLDAIGGACTYYFVFEAVLKVFAYGYQSRGVNLLGNVNLCEGWRAYWSTRSDYMWNRLDFSVLLIVMSANVLENTLTSSGVNASSLRALRVLRAIRILRAFKLSHLWTPLSNTMTSLTSVAPAVASLAVLIAILTLCFGLLGKELFHGSGLVCVVGRPSAAPLAGM